MQTQTLNPVFGPKHQAYISRAKRSTISVAEGAVRAGKTIDNIAAFAYMIHRGTPDRIHLATGSTVANAKLNIGDANGYGLEYIFRGRCRWTKYKGNEALAIKSKGREYVVIFSGGAKSDSYKKIRGNSYGMWIATEINLHHDDTIKEAFNRQLAARNRRIFWDLNPTAPSAWIYTDYIDRFDEQFGANYNYEHFTIYDNATISKARLAEIESQYIPGTIWYQRDILGERCIAEGLVYPMFDRERHILSEEPETEGDYYVSSDYGIQNPNVWLLWRKERGSNRWICLREDYYSGRDEKHQLTDKELVDRLDAMTSMFHVKQIIIDPSAASMKAELHRRGYHTRNAHNEVLDGISDVCYMLGAGNLAFMECCENTIAEFGAYLWDSNAVDAGEDAPLKENDHCLTGDTLVDTLSGPVRIDELVGKSGVVYCTDGEKVLTGHFHDVRMTREEAEVFEITLADGRSVKATADHPILTRRGWVQIKDLRGDDEIACIEAIGLSFAGIASIKPLGKQPVYNMEVDDYHNFSVNGGIIVHNCMDATRYMVRTMRLVQRTNRRGDATL